MNGLKKLEPGIVWQFFYRITAIPRPSKKEEKITRFLVEFAEEQGLEYETDRTGNLLIRKPATKGMEDRPKIVLQSHMDMVCEKNSGVEFDFDNDPIKTVVTGDGWVRAEGTTLGADCGIGMAAELAVLASHDIRHPAIEALFTVDEETGLTGAYGLSPTMLRGKYLINLDSEDEGEIFIGCAGGIDTVATFKAGLVDAPVGYDYFRLAVSGLIGGHSGDDIDKGRANSNKLAARFLAALMRDVPAVLASIEGGNLRNAIPREAFAVFGCPHSYKKRLNELFARFAEAVKDEYRHTNKNIDLTIKEVEAPLKVIENARAMNLIDALNGVPNGVFAMSFAMPGLVETSSNLASVKPGEGNTIVVTSSQRSAIDSAKHAAVSVVRSVYELAGAQVSNSDGYPGWNPDPSSYLLRVSEEQYVRLFGRKPKVRAIHAGLECGLFLEKYPHLEMISIGPTIRNAHSPDEKLEIAAVAKFWRHLVAVIENI